MEPPTDGIREHPCDVSPPAVKRALRALAVDDSARSGTAGSASPAQLVATAESAMSDVDTAATFVENGGLARLRQAVAIAMADDQEDLARRGRAVLATVERYRRAAGRQAEVPTPDADHFHSGRGTVLGTSGQESHR